MAGYPYIKETQRIEEIEAALPDALKQMADTLRVGGTYEYALREISTAGYGALTKETDAVLRKLEEGENLENSMRALSENVDSVLVKRSVTIIVDSIKAGAGLADVLEEISSDIRELHRIGIERKSRTMMEFMFIVSAGAIVAPAIFGMVSSIIGYLIQTVASGNISSPEAIAFATQTKDFIVLLLQAYIAFEVVASGAMISIMREGKISKSLIYIPGLLFIAFLVYYGAAAATVALISGG
jgi:archaellum biogenesis protein FlaJ (TadC family)